MPAHRMVRLLGLLCAGTQPKVSAAGASVCKTAWMRTMSRLRGMFMYVYVIYTYVHVCVFVRALACNIYELYLYIPHTHTHTHTQDGYYRADCGHNVTQPEMLPTPGSCLPCPALSHSVGNRSFSLDSENMKKCPHALKYTHTYTHTHTHSYIYQVASACRATPTSPPPREHLLRQQLQPPLNRARIVKSASIVQEFQLLSV
jgi:hypothetical protein